MVLNTGTKHFAVKSLHPKNYEIFIYILPNDIPPQYPPRPVRVDFGRPNNIIGRNTIWGGFTDYVARVPTSFEISNNVVPLQNNRFLSPTKQCKPFFTFWNMTIVWHMNAKPYNNKMYFFFFFYSVNRTMKEKCGVGHSTHKEILCSGILGFQSSGKWGKKSGGKPDLGVFLYRFWVGKW